MHQDIHIRLWVDVNAVRKDDPRVGIFLFLFFFFFFFSFPPLQRSDEVCVCMRPPVGVGFLRRLYMHMM